jgi:catechol O-methyltransferase
VYNRPDVEKIRGRPERVLAAIDEFARTRKYLMNVGEDKGKIVTELIKERRPEVMVELGGYIGYSCILFGAAVKDAGGKRYWSFERNPEFAAVATSLADVAGLSDVVKVVVGPSDSTIKRLHASGALSHIDMMFLDHYKPAYTTDLKLCEELEMVTPGTVLAADNVVHPGNPPYLEYVRSTCDQKRQNTSKQTLNGVDTRFADRTANQYKTRQGQEKLDETRTGNPNLVYESKLIESFEPNGIPVSSKLPHDCSRLLTGFCRMASKLLVACQRRYGRFAPVACLEHWWTKSSGRIMMT